MRETPALKAANAKIKALTNERDSLEKSALEFKELYDNENQRYQESVRKANDGAKYFEKLERENAGLKNSLETLTQRRREESDHNAVLKREVIYLRSTLSRLTLGGTHINDVTRVPTDI